jgi:hypothetical protein
MLDIFIGSALSSAVMQLGIAPGACVTAGFFYSSYWIGFFGACLGYAT